MLVIDDKLRRDDKQLAGSNGVRGHRGIFWGAFEDSPLTYVAAAIISYQYSHWKMSIESLKVSGVIVNV